MCKTRSKHTYLLLALHDHVPGFAVDVRFRFCNRERRARVEFKRQHIRAHDGVRGRAVGARRAQQRAVDIQVLHELHARAKVLALLRRKHEQDRAAYM
jgi:hypothetical protein